MDALLELANETDRSVPQVAINWLLQRPTVSTVLIGARDERQLRENLDAADWSRFNARPERWGRRDRRRVQKR